MAARKKKSASRTAPKATRSSGKSRPARRAAPSRPTTDSGPPPAAQQKADIERHLQAQLAAITGGLAPDDYARSWLAWYLGLAEQPQRQQELAQSGWEKLLDAWQFAAQAAGGKPLPPGHDTMGFNDPAWNQWPFNVYARSYGNWASWLQQAMQPAPGSDARLSPSAFSARLLVEAASPANFLVTNPELLQRTAAESGQNLVRGLKNWLEDAKRLTEGGPARGTEGFKVGRDVAVTPGKVVLRNRLIELLQYSPQTPAVYAEPVFITPAWIMKYYILDLSARNSLVRYLVEKGHTVFMISWKNPEASDRDLGMDDYLQLGFLDALERVRELIPRQKVHAVGYCIGGTLLAIAAALLAARGEQPLASLTLLAAQMDFSEPGELSVFITPSQIATLEAMMQEAGVLESERMGGAFAMLRSRDLLWAPAVQQYVRGERPKLNDLMAWNSDGTRMPARMHSEYLERLYLRNELAGGKFKALGVQLDPSRITVPMFVVGTETDHVAPWHSVYKARGLTRSTDYTFLLTSGGHNAGIVSGPVHPKRRHRMLTWHNATQNLTPAEWFRTTPAAEGSWWPAWEQWLAQHSSSKQVAPRNPKSDPALQGAADTQAPGRYVLG